MMHPTASTKSSSRWLNNSTKVELFSVILVLLLIGGVLTPILTQTRITRINCQIDQATCPAETNDQLQSLLNRPILLTNLIAQLESNNILSSYQTHTSSLTLPNTLNLTLSARPPAYFLTLNDQNLAVSSDGRSSQWTGDLPTNTPQIIANSIIDTSNKLSANFQGNHLLHTRLLKLIDALQISQLKYNQLELLDQDTVKIWINDLSWALIDPSQPDAIQKLLTTLDHPEFVNQTKNNFQLDLRFQYPVLLKSD